MTSNPSPRFVFILNVELAIWVRLMPTYEEVLDLAKRLPLADQARLLEALAVSLPHPVEVEGTDEIISAEEISESEAALQADECLYWMELLVESEAKLKSLMAEVNEIVAMTVQSIKTLRARSQKTANPKSKIPSAR